jgi:hypothetical protein
MSLFNLCHQSVVLKFADCAKPQFDPTASLVYRLTAVDGMGFLEIQETRIGADGLHEVVGAPFWINKDLVTELHPFSADKVFTNLRFSGPAVKAAKPTTPESSTNGAIKAKARSVKPKATPGG